jgi:hypothetical protein
VSVIACDFVYRSRCQHFRQVSQLGTFFSLLSYRARGPRSMAARPSTPGRQGHDPRRRGAARMPRRWRNSSTRVLSIYRRMPKSKARADNYLGRLRKRSGHTEGAIDHLAG